MVFKSIQAENVNEGLFIPEVQKIVKRGKLIVLMIKNDYNPLFSMKQPNGERVGVDIDISKKLANALGVDLEIRDCYDKYDDVVDAIAKGEGDIGISKLSYTVERARKVIFSSPYVLLKKGLLINRVNLSKNRNTPILKDLLNRKESQILISPGSYVNFTNVIFPDATVIQSQKWDTEGLTKLAEGEYLAAFRDELRIRLALREQPRLSIHLLPVILKEEADPIHMIVNKNNFGFLLWVDYFLENYMHAYTLDQLFNEYGKYLR
ncbi:MAG: transporter substrate-binding domain-containing protein [Proteobacteria bacterium]|nr:transporter substrate-binding domain-containing protein [Pseudomonadota bacterium]